MHLALSPSTRCARFSSSEPPNPRTWGWDTLATRAAMQAPSSQSSAHSLDFTGYPEQLLLKFESETDYGYLPASVVRALQTKAEECVTKLYRVWSTSNFESDRITLTVGVPWHGVLEHCEPGTLQERFDNDLPVWQPWSFVFYNRVNVLLHQRHAWIVKMEQEFRRRNALPLSDPYHTRITPAINEGHGDGVSPCSSKKLGRVNGVPVRTIGIYVYIGHLRRLYRLKSDRIARGEMNHEMCANTVSVGLLARRESTAPPLAVGDRVRVRRAIQHPRYNWGNVTHESVGTLLSIDNPNRVTVNFAGCQKPWLAQLHELELAPAPAPAPAPAAPAAASSAAADDDVVITKEVSRADKTAESKRNGIDLTGSDDDGAEAASVKTEAAAPAAAPRGKSSQRPDPKFAKGARVKVAFDDGVWYPGTVVSSHWGWRRSAYTYDIAFDTGYKLGRGELAPEGSIRAEDEPEPAEGAPAPAPPPPPPPPAPSQPDDGTVPSGSLDARVLICRLHEQPGVPDLTAYLDAYRERTLDKYEFIRKIKEVVGVDILRKALMAARPARSAAAAATAGGATAAAASAAGGPVDEAVKRKRDEHWAQLREVTKAARKEVGEVESIEASRNVSAEKEYLVKWKGFDEKYNTWRKASELADTRVQALIDAFEATPEAAGAAVAEA